MNIGVFDSGLGGLTVLKKCRELMPKYNYIYLADNANVPYGSKTRDEIYELTKNAVEYLFKQDCKLVVLACNTATANALRTLQMDWLPAVYPDRRILGVIRPTVESVVESGARRVGVLATEASVRSNAFEEELKKLDPTIEVFEQACPKLVPVIEASEWAKDETGSRIKSGMTQRKVQNDDEEVQDDLSTKDKQAKTMMHDVFLQLIIKQYISPLLLHNIDTLLLGCTHYELIQDQIKAQLPPTVTIISEATTSATKLKEYLVRHQEIDNALTKELHLNFHFTADSPEYRAKAEAYI